MRLRPSRACARTGLENCANFKQGAPGERSDWNNERQCQPAMPCVKLLREQKQFGLLEWARSLLG